MTKRIIEAAFKKAERETGRETVNANAKFLSEYILESYKYSISTKSVTRYYKGESSPNLQVLNYLAQYLGYDNYETYLAWNSGLDKEELDSIPGQQNFLSSKKTLAIISILIIVIAVSGYIGFKNGESHCMVWKHDHYEKVDCTGSIGEKKIVPYIFNNFRKVQVSDTTTFFKKGEVQIWYDKSNNDVEFFTAPGIHPSNGKTLKPISEYMIEKYIKN